MVLLLNADAYGCILLVGHPFGELCNLVSHGLDLKENARAEGVSARFGVDSESASDLSCGIGVSETAECWEKVQRTSARPHINLVPGGNGNGTCLTGADT